MTITVGNFPYRLACKPCAEDIELFVVSKPELWSVPHVDATSTR
jgi:hypothetical protein